MKKTFLLTVFLGGLLVGNAHGTPQPAYCLGGWDVTGTYYWYLLDETGAYLEDGDWCYVAWKGPDGLKDPPNETEPNCGDVTGDDEILGEGTTYYGTFDVTYSTYDPPDGQHPVAGEYVYARIFNEPKYPSCETGWYGDSDQYEVTHVGGESFYAQFPGDPGYGHTDTPIFPGTLVEWLEPSAGLPAEYFLRQNYPNPFNPVTEIMFAIPKDVHVTLRVYNVLGAEVATLVDAHQEAGFYTVRWDAEDLPSGVYFFTIRAGDFKATKKMVLLK